MAAMRAVLKLGRGTASKIHSTGPVLQRSYGTVTERVLQSLQSMLGKENVSTSESVREQHVRDESYHDTMPPEAVVFPSTVEQVQEIARLCHNDRIPMTPFGTGTGLEGGTGALKGGVCVAMRKMDAIVEVQTDDLYATVEPGVTRVGLNQYLRDTGLWFPIDPGADASLCGMAATNASGTNAVRYGAMRENVLNLEVVLADGTLLHTAGLKGRARKRSAGYNLTNLFVGSEGTLGLITKTTVKIYGVPEATVAAVCSFPDVRSAVTTSVQTLQSAIPVARMEFLNKLSVAATNRFFKSDYPEVPTLFMEFTGSERAVQEQAEAVGGLAHENGGSDFIWERDHEARAHLWKARHNLLYSSLALQPGKKGFLTDVCVPLSALPQVLVESENLLEGSSFTAPIFGHVGDGNFHCVMLVDLEDPQEIELATELSTKIARLAISAGGTCTGEHGIGRGKRQLLTEEMGEVGVALMMKLKRTLDPHLLMNPGKVLLPT